MGNYLNHANVFKESEGEVKKWLNEIIELKNWQVFALVFLSNVVGSALYDLIKWLVK